MIQTVGWWCQVSRAPEGRHLHGEHDVGRPSARLATTSQKEYTM